MLLFFLCQIVGEYGSDKILWAFDHCSAVFYSIPLPTQNCPESLLAWQKRVHQSFPADAHLIPHANKTTLYKVRLQNT